MPRIGKNIIRDAFKKLVKPSSGAMTPDKADKFFKANADTFSGKYDDIADSVVRSMKDGSGKATVSADEARNFLKKATAAAKGAIKQGQKFTLTKRGTEYPGLGEKGFKAEVLDKINPGGPSKEIIEGRKRINQYNAYKTQYGNADPVAVARGETNKPAEQVNVSSPKKRTDNVVPFARGTSLPKSIGIDTGTSMVGTFGQADDSQKDTSTNISTGKITDINKYREEKEKDKNTKKEAENSGKFGKDIQDSFDIDNDNSNIKKVA